jgi:hypothetical protein
MKRIQLKTTKVKRHFKPVHLGDSFERTNINDIISDSNILKDSETGSPT